MTKYLLIHCCEREIEPPKVFDTLEQAKKALYKEVCSAMKIPRKRFEEMKSYYSADIIYDGTCGFAVVCGDAYDWQIYKMEL